MTTDEARDEVAKILGGTIGTDPVLCETLLTYTVQERFGPVVHHVAIDTIDGIAALWPEEWDFDVARYNTDGYSERSPESKWRWQAHALIFMPGETKPIMLDEDAATEYDARLHLLLAVLRATKGRR